MYKGKKLFVVVNHFSSKGEDQPLFGRFQPPTRVQRGPRHQQAQVVNDFVDQLVAVNPRERGRARRHQRLRVLGDRGHPRGRRDHDLMKKLLPRERYSYVFEGNSQVLDQILVTNHLSIAVLLVLRRRARQRGVREPGVRPRPAGRLQPGADEGQGRIDLRKQQGEENMKKTRARPRRGACSSRSRLGDGGGGPGPGPVPPSSHPKRSPDPGVNDFHGNLEPPTGSGGGSGRTDAGGVEYLATHIRGVEGDESEHAVRLRGRPDRRDAAPSRRSSTTSRRSRRTT